MITILTDNNLFQRAVDDGKIAVGKPVINSPDLFYQPSQLLGANRNKLDGVLQGKNLTGKELYLDYGTFTNDINHINNAKMNKGIFKMDSGPQRNHDLSQRNNDLEMHMRQSSTSWEEESDESRTPTDNTRGQPNTRPLMISGLVNLDPGPGSRSRRKIQIGTPLCASPSNRINMGCATPIFDIAPQKVAQKENPISIQRRKSYVMQ